MKLFLAVLLIACTTAVEACPPALAIRSRPYGSVTVVQSAPMLMQVQAAPTTVAVLPARISGGDKRRAHRLARHGHNVQLNQ